MLLGNAGCLKNIVFQFLLRAPGVQNKERHQKHSLVLALQLFEQGFRIPSVSCQVGRDNVNIIPGADGFFLFLNLTSVQFRDGALDRLNGAVLVYALDVHGDDLRRIHVQKVLQKLVGQVGCRDAQKAGGAVDAAHLECAAVLKGKRRRCNGIFHRKPAFHKVVPIKTELGRTVHVEHIMHQFEPLGTVQRPRQHTQPVKVVEQIILDVVEAGLDLPHTLALHAKGDEFAFGQAIIAFGKLLTQHLRILGTNIIKPIPLEWDADAFFKLGAIRCHVDERQLELNAGIEEVQKAAPFLENCSLIFLLCQLVIDVLIGNRPGVVVRLNPTSAILKHPLHRDGLLRSFGNICLGRLLLAAILILFPERNHGLRLLSSELHSSCWSCTVESSGAETVPEDSATAAFPSADRFSRTFRGKRRATSPPSCRGSPPCCRRFPGAKRKAALRSVPPNRSR